MKLDGREIAEQIFKDLETKVEQLRERNIIPNLAIILVGNDPASQAYVNQKKIKAELIKAKTIIKHLPSDTSQLELLKTIQQFNNSNNIHGIIVQQPLPPHINIEKITQAIDPKKDVDGFHVNSKFETPIALAVFKILEEIFARCNLNQGATLIKWLRIKQIAIAGKGKTGGKSIIEMLEKVKIKPSIIDSKTNNPKDITKKADIIISAVGKSNIVKPNMVKKGAVLISIGLHKGLGGKLKGDYNEEKIKDIVSFYTPTPGGVGPVNVAMLLKNLIESAQSSSR